MKVGSRPWTEADCLQLEKLIKEGLSYDEISEIIGRSPLSVAGKANNMGLAKFKGGEGAKAFEAAKSLIPTVSVHQSTFARWMGDPPPGRSALDQRRQ
ncbi:MAG: hypothetical protein P0Y65_05710 [Candidatus Devosia phytovorans]|uniref:Myb-like domain-containing protein n=1 Tax=Candidatus Devosia phytovorans TaxID=3121372 RepID=A0AAJ6B1G2_9HYPH|nr:hypothetical protein [Devosia sp.]WEK05751.1 MAG: hypothetical protein P0Y65_05710 [Devosia sp.]